MSELHAAAFPFVHHRFQLRWPVATFDQYGRLCLAEYFFSHGPCAAAAASPAGLFHERWPVDTKLAANVELHSRCRRPKPVAEFADARADLAAKLAQKGVTPLTDAEFVGCRLYTGPLFVKYNGVLRGAHGRVPAFVATMEEMCRGNLYATTLHTIADGMRRLSLLTPCDHVYRGMSGGRLPPSFSEADPSGAVGGVEFGFMSTTRNKEVAFEYAQRCGIVFAIEQGMVDRGASIEWLSRMRRRGSNPRIQRALRCALTLAFGPRARCRIPF